MILIILGYCTGFYGNGIRLMFNLNSCGKLNSRQLDRFCHKIIAQSNVSSIIDQGNRIPGIYKAQYSQTERIYSIAYLFICLLSHVCQVDCIYMYYRTVYPIINVCKQSCQYYTSAKVIKIFQKYSKMFITRRKTSLDISWLRVQIFGTSNVGNVSGYDRSL